MIDKFNDLFKELKDRVSNPIISSFIVSWLVFNWDIIIILFFYRINEVKVDGYNSFIDYINKNNSTSKILWLPLIGSIFYTFIFPFLKNCIIAFNSWIKSWGTSWALEVSKSGKISMERYLELRKKYTEKTDTLEELIEKQSEFVTAREKTYEENLILQKGLNEKQNELTDFKNMCSVTAIIGFWKMRFWFTENKKSEYYVEINHTTITQQNDDGSYIELYKILGYFIDVRNLELILFVQLQEEVKKYMKLKYNSDFTKLEGKIDNKIIEFIKN